MLHVTASRGVHASELALHSRGAGGESVSPDWQPRSEHAAVVHGQRLIVFGGWPAARAPLIHLSVDIDLGMFAPSI
jgi:hypothetical protein